LYSGKRNAEVRLYAFDLLSDDGLDMRDETLHTRKLWLGKPLKRSGDGILYNEHEAGAIGPRLFE
jgi:ATP-dependent DNA ligase